MDWYHLSHFITKNTLQKIERKHNAVTALIPAKRKKIIQWEEGGKNMWNQFGCCLSYVS